MSQPFDAPFDAAITRFYESDTAKALRETIDRSDKGDILDPAFPHSERLPRKAYQAEMDALQIELVKMQSWARSSGARVVILFEGRDAAGKGGTIKRFRENLNPRGARVVALSKPSETERGQWYFQRYINHLPTEGEITFFDRSWYNRAVVEHVFGFCSAAERALFFDQVMPMERMLTNDGIHLVKIWLNVGRAEQLRRFLWRERDPLKHWKLSRIDVEGLGKWDAYTRAIAETFQRTHSDAAPWTVVRSDDKRRARIQAVRAVLHGLDYTHKDPRALGAIDATICGGPDVWNA